LDKSIKRKQALRRLAGQRREKKGPITSRRAEKKKIFKQEEGHGEQWQNSTLLNVHKKQHAARNRGREYKRN